MEKRAKYATHNAPAIVIQAKEGGEAEGYSHGHVFMDWQPQSLLLEDNVVQWLKAA